MEPVGIHCYTGPYHTLVKSTVGLLQEDVIRNTSIECLVAFTRLICYRRIDHDN